VIKMNILPRSNGNSDQRATSNLQQETLKTNCVTQYFCHDNIKHSNVPQETIQAEKTTVSDSIIAAKVAESVDGNVYRDIGRDCIEPNNQCGLKERLIRDLIEQHDLNFQSVHNVNICARESPEERNDKESLPNVENTTLETNTMNQNQDLEHRQMSPHTQTSTKIIRTIASKEKTERCNICGFHFPDTNILALHKQLVHEQDLSNDSEKVLKNYSCHLCSKVFKMRGSLMVHMRVAHVGHILGK